MRGGSRLRLRRPGKTHARVRVEGLTGTCQEQFESNHVIAEFFLAGGPQGFTLLPRLRGPGHGLVQRDKGLGRWLALLCLRSC